MNPISRMRSRSAMARVAAACTTGAKSAVHDEHRAAHAQHPYQRAVLVQRPVERSARGGQPRAAADRCTDAGSVECRATSADVIATGSGSARRAGGAAPAGRAAAAPLIDDRGRHVEHPAGSPRHVARDSGQPAKKL